MSHPPSLPPNASLQTESDTIQMAALSACTPSQQAQVCELTSSLTALRGETPLTAATLAWMWKERRPPPVLCQELVPAGSAGCGSITHRESPPSPQTTGGCYLRGCSSLALCTFCTVHCRLHQWSSATRPSRRSVEPMPVFEGLRRPASSSRFTLQPSPAVYINYHNDYGGGAGWLALG